MPHLGRPYPYHPIYWATEGWFYPHYVPWKMRFIVWGVNLEPWDGLYYGLELVSDEGQVSEDIQVIQYKWHFDDAGFHYDITLSMEARKDLVPGKAQWLLALKRDDVPWAIASKLEVIPPSSNVLITWDDGFNLQTGMPCDPPFFQLFQATYAEGGTPYPHPTGGG